jgi:phage/plasmid-associated DNA primase
MILNHVGSSLNGKVPPWGDVVTGGDYLRAYVAAIFQDPFCHLPYLFLYGPENSGKSIFHEAVALLLTGGVVSAVRALTDPKSFNGELKGAVLCTVEELDVANSRVASARIKDYTTSPTLSIRQLYMPPHNVANTTHWVQCANKITYCPVFPGDTRITVCKVGPPPADIPKHELITRLKLEAPNFLRSILDMPLPPATGRLRVPVVETDSKESLQETNENPLAEFIREKNLAEPGGVVLVADLYRALNAWLPWETEKYKIKRTLTELTEYECFKESNRWKVRGLKIE